MRCCIDDVDRYILPAALGGDAGIARALALACR
jgi:hypothetical protein